MELISIKERLPSKNGKYLVLTSRKPFPPTAHIGKMPMQKDFEIVQFVVNPRGIGEQHKVPYWYYPFGESEDNSEFITHWAELPEKD